VIPYIRHGLCSGYLVKNVYTLIPVLMPYIRQRLCSGDLVKNVYTFIPVLMPYIRHGLSTRAHVKNVYSFNLKNRKVFMGHSRLTQTPKDSRILNYFKFEV
jgi:hypothetical protein